jgi:hypothetical protein
MRDAMIAGLGYESTPESPVGPEEAFADFDEVVATQRIYLGERQHDRFNRLRRLTEQLLDESMSYVTVSRLISAARGRLDAALDPDGQDAEILLAIAGLFAVLDQDRRVFQAMNRCDARRTASCAQEARAMTGAVARGLDGVAHPLAPELRDEAAALHRYYDGIGRAASRFEAHERAVELQYAVEQPHEGPLDIDPDAFRITADYVRHCIVEIAAAPEGQAGLRATRHRCRSRLSCWAHVLDATADRFEPDIRGLRFRTVKLVYCYPFAVRLDLPRRLALRADLRSAARGHPTSRPLRELCEDLDELLGSGAPVRPLTTNELWAGAGGVVYNGASIALGRLREVGPAGDAVDARRAFDSIATLKLSLLGNHCLCVERTLDRPTPHDLFRALRAGADYARDLEYRFRLDPGRAAPGPTGREWRSVHEFARDAIRVTAEALGQPDDWKCKRGDVRLIGVFTTDEALGDDVDEIGRALDRDYGGRMLRAHTQRTATALHEWVRYPTSGNAILTVPELGYRSDWLAATDDSSLFCVAGQPSWQTDAYVEAGQFAASCSAPLLLWDREAFDALDRRATTLTTSDELRHLQLDALEFTTAINADALCWSRAYRRLLDCLLQATRTRAIAGELHARLSAVELARDKKEHSARARSERNRNVLLAFVAAFGVFNLSTHFQLLSGRHTSAELRAQWLAAGLVVLALAIVWIADPDSVPRRGLRRLRFRRAGAGVRPPPPDGHDRG